MFERFTERARSVMGLSRQEAQRLGSEFIGTEHMLVAILLEGESVAATILKNLQVDLKRVRRQIEMLMPPPARSTMALGQLPFSPRCKGVIEMAAEASAEMGHELVDTEHLLIGLVEETEGIAAKVLTNLGLRLGEVYGMVTEVIGAATVREVRWSERMRSVVLDAASTAKVMGSPSIDPEHLLWAILNEGSPLSEMLVKQGVTPVVVRPFIR